MPSSLVRGNCAGNGQVLPPTYVLIDTGGGHEPGGSGGRRPLFHVAFPASQPQWRQWFGIGLSEGRLGERAPNSEVAAAFAVEAGERLQIERLECALPLTLLEDSDVFRARVAARVAERATPTRLAPRHLQ